MKVGLKIRNNLFEAINFKMNFFKSKKTKQMRTIAFLTVFIGLSITNVSAQEISEEGARKEMTPEQKA